MKKRPIIWPWGIFKGPVKIEKVTKRCDRKVKEVRQEPRENGLWEARKRDATAVSKVDEIV